MVYGPSAQDPRLPGSGGSPYRRREHRRRGIPADGDPATAARIIRYRPAREIGQARCGIREPLDQPKRGRGSMHDRGQQRRKQRSRYLVSQVGKEASATDAAHAATEPPRSAFAAFSLSRHDCLSYGWHTRQIDGDRWRCP